MPTVTSKISDGPATFTSTKSDDEIIQDIRDDKPFAVEMPVSSTFFDNVVQLLITSPPTNTPLWGDTITFVSRREKGKMEVIGDRDLNAMVDQGVQTLIIEGAANGLYIDLRQSINGCFDVDKNELVFTWRTGGKFAFQSMRFSYGPDSQGYGPADRFQEEVTKRNERLGIGVVDGRIRGMDERATLSSSVYNISTCQELDVLHRSASSGNSGKGWSNDVQANTRVFSQAGLSHSVRLEAAPEEIAKGQGLDPLERLTKAQNADSIFATLYISNLLAPDMLPQGSTAVGWINLDDVAKVIDPNHPFLPAAQREAGRKAVYDYLCFVERAMLCGERSVPYYDRTTKQKIDTYIESPLWSIQGRQRPVQTSLMPQWEVPVAVEIALSREWVRILMHPELRQFLPMGQLLGGIPNSQPSGAWARIIGLTLANHWRMKPKEALSGNLTLTRRELLTRYRPKSADPEEVLKSKNPGRAIDYWAGSLGILAEQKFIAPKGEALPGVALKRLGKDGNPLPSRNWAEQWLDAEIVLYPGPAMESAVRDRSRAKVEPKRVPFASIGAKSSRGPRASKNVTPH